MGKATALWGKTSGKVGGLVYATSGGETIVREYNPNVANPSTSAQVDQRARMKLMSQLSAAIKPSLAIAKTGLVSARNKFTKLNFAFTYALNGVAQVSYENLQLTEGNLGIPSITILAGDGKQGRWMVACLSTDYTGNISRVVYNVFRKSDEGKLTFYDSKIQNVKFVDNLVEEGTFPFGVDWVGLPLGDLVIFAYGMIDANEKATASYGDLQVQDGTDIAKLVASRAINFTDYQFTQTRGKTLLRNNEVAVDPTQRQVGIYVTALGDGGTVSGGGAYDVGAQVTLTATAANGYKFRAWLRNGTNQVVSTDNPYTFTAQTQLDLVAAFDAGGNDSL